MKKILALLLSVFALSAQAKENITIVYSWSAGDQAANYWRNLAATANKQQDKYNFIVDYKPGAGGAVAANHVLNNPNEIQATSSAFYIRAMLYPKESQNLDQFQSVLPICFAPFSISSSKYKSWKEVPTDQPLTIGISGLGTTTHLTALQIVKKYPLMKIVPFKSTSDAVHATMSGTIDFAVGFVGDSTPFQGPNSMDKHSYILGLSGTKSINQTPLLTDQGFPSVLSKFGSPAQAVAPTTMPATQYKEVRQILLKVAKDSSVLKVESEDYCFFNAEQTNMDPVKFYQWNRDLWSELTEGVQIK